ncbi:MAG: hypothetical protein GEV11_10165 [Streptosporangiales bacterium]|nr:hypothetical protein [Streptosporangiales bacterium]
MAARHDRALRRIRGGVLAATCTLLALVGHLLGEGGMPPLSALVVIGAVIGAVSVTLARHRGTFLGVFSVIGWSQLAFHFAFEVAERAHPLAAHAHAYGAAPPVLSTGGVLGGWGMALGHELAAVVAAGLLAYGESALWRLLRLVFHALFGPTILTWPALSDAPSVRPERPGDDLPLFGERLATAVQRRGPPVVAGAS